jgi:hypothetical protein
MEIPPSNTWSRQLHPKRAASIDNSESLQSIRGVLRCTYSVTAALGHEVLHRFPGLRTVISSVPPALRAAPVNIVDPGVAFAGARRLSLGGR